VALRITEDYQPPTWYKRKVWRGYQVGFAWPAKKFMVDIEVAFWRFACYIGFKYPYNPRAQDYGESPVMELLKLIKGAER
jgi:hypothetical protein